jgi:hypothetical protein
MEAGTTCTPVADASVATTNFGNAAWACTQQLCPALAQCAADCDCNNAVLLALACTADAGGAMPTFAQTAACFGDALSVISADPNVPSTLGACLEGAGVTCAGFDAGTDAAAEAGHSEAGTSDAGPEAGTSEAGTSEAGSEAGTPEAGLDAAVEASPAP